MQPLLKFASLAIAGGLLCGCAAMASQNPSPPSSHNCTATDPCVVAITVDRADDTKAPTIPSDRTNVLVQSGQRMNWTTNTQVLIVFPKYLDTPIQDDDGRPLYSFTVAPLAGP